jgi:hypothetical protein
MAKNTGQSTNSVAGKFGFSISDLIKDLQGGRTKKLEILKQKMKCEDVRKARLNYFRNKQPA